ncbi:hypothetical protein K7X08_022053 [Anisodus acutangulus]|uniref:Uncharacterized protein n=1 Tax=Anisodus acutangulus TaxID=402998 RepID=A0A9Q1QX25_9SOLA|nr:hypothetical protein K7X08_022053 [Anisodus acutangulus]
MVILLGLLRTFVVNAIVATDQEMQYFSVALPLDVDPSSSSSGIILPRGLIDHLVDGFVSDVKKQLDDERSSIVNQITIFESRFDGLDTRFEDLNSKFVGVINVVENLVRVHNESKSFVGAAKSIIRTSLVNRIQSLKIELINAIESLVQLLHETNSRLVFGGSPKSTVLGDSVGEEVDYQALNSQQINDVNQSIVEATTVDIPILDAVSRKRRRCDNGKKDDNDLPRWNLITSEYSVVGKHAIYGD